MIRLATSLLSMFLCFGYLFSQSVEERTDYGLLFASGIYQYWDDLEDPVEDAKDVEKDLKELYGFTTELIANQGRAGFTEKLKDYAGKDYGEFDQLLIWIAGHSHSDDENKTGFVILSDSKLDESETWLSFRDLSELVADIPCNRIFLVMDIKSKYPFPEITPAAASRQPMSSVTRTEYLEMKLSEPFRKYMMSAGNGYTNTRALKDFAYAFLEGLRTNGGSDGILTMQDILMQIGMVKDPARLGVLSEKDRPGSTFIFEYRRED